MPGPYPSNPACDLCICGTVCDSVQPAGKDGGEESEDATFISSPRQAETAWGIPGATPHADPPDGVRGKVWG